MALLNASASDFEIHGPSDGAARPVIVLRNQKTFFLERPIVVAFGRYLVALPVHNMPPKKRKQDDSAAEADDAKPEPEIDHAQSAIEHISHCTMEELKLVNEQLYEGGIACVCSQPTRLTPATR